jgi:hypothetical protein
MADVWLPGAHRDPGRNAGYNSGRSTMDRAVAHYTVGSDSRNVGRDGYFHFLVHRDASRESGCTQYAEVDAVTWHAADAGNPYGPGVEWERNVTGGINAEGLSDAEPLTDNQVEWGSRLVGFFAEHGIPVALYDGPRYGEGGWRGWVNHQAIDSSRSDGLLRAEWDLIAGGGAPAVDDEPEDDVYVRFTWAGGRYLSNLMQFRWISDEWDDRAISRFYPSCQEAGEVNGLQGFGIPADPVSAELAGLLWPTRDS